MTIVQLSYTSFPSLSLVMPFLRNSSSISELHNSVQLDKPRIIVITMLQCLVVIYLEKVFIGWFLAENSQLFSLPS